MANKEIQVKVDLVGLMVEMAKTCGGGTSYGVVLAVKGLETLTNRAVALNDPELNKALEFLGLASED